MSGIAMTPEGDQIPLSISGKQAVVLLVKSQLVDPKLSRSHSEARLLFDFSCATGLWASNFVGAMLCDFRADDAVPSGSPALTNAVARQQYLVQILAVFRRLLPCSIFPFSEAPR
ncbi:hypothetical protein [Paraburkholderia sp. BL6665CI2N2]|uniref:hypothetical protein n=1 Tax=Paraburkholderia sp. BL6665CI2N2 TaxID=1938806 RepID=UPI001066DA0C|nr:hypothetical protein [Paraburkholderia sp. BL6665CI2N2]